MVYSHALCAALRSLRLCVFVFNAEAAENAEVSQRRTRVRAWHIPTPSASTLCALTTLSALPSSFALKLKGADVVSRPVAGWLICDH